WRYTIANGGSASLDSLSYSDGLKYSIYTRDANGRRVPNLPAAGYDKQMAFETWLAGSPYQNVTWPDGLTRPPLDTDRNNAIDPSEVGGQLRAEATYLDTHGQSAFRNPDGWLSDDERDEDADGLSNWVELGGPMMPGWYEGVYTDEKPFPIKYEGT